ncbi:MFS transporter [Aerococcus tenax]|uniref:MFS transporter n=1 Tax=Aerococcus tenax TaxID=3078812 RepID=UPI0018A7903F|nr:MFS transporter [Aerococcus tenax]
MNNKINLNLYGLLSNAFFESSIWMIYLSQNGWNMLEIGFVQAMLNISQVLTEVPSGYIGDKIGHKKVLNIAQIFIILYSLSYLFVHTKFIVYLGFILYGFGLSLKSGTDQALIYNDIGEGDSKKYTSLIGQYNAFIIIGMSISTLFGGMIANVNWSLVFIITIVIQLVSLIFLNTLPSHHSISNQPSEKTNLIAEIKVFLLENKNYRHLIYSIVLSQSIISIMYQYCSVFFSSYGISVSHISIIFFIIYLITATISFHIENILKKINIRNLIISTLTLSIILSLIINIDMKWISALSFIIVLILFEIFDTSENIILNDTIPNNIRATMLSVSNLLTALLMSIESVAIGILAKHINIGSLISMCLALFLAASLLIFIISSKRSKN